MQHAHLSCPCLSKSQQQAASLHMSVCIPSALQRTREMHLNTMRLIPPAGASTALSLQMGPSGDGTSHLMRSSLSWQRPGRSSSAVPTTLTAMSWPAALIRAESGSLTLLRRSCCKSTSSTGRGWYRCCTCLLASCSSAWVRSHHYLVVSGQSPITASLSVHGHQSLPCCQWTVPNHCLVVSGRSPITALLLVGGHQSLLCC